MVNASHTCSVVSVNPTGQAEGGMLLREKER